jgi:hypothetical protein
MIVARADKKDEEPRSPDFEGGTLLGAGVLKGSEECDEVLFLVPGQLRAKDQVEELD